MSDLVVSDGVVRWTCSDLSRCGPVGSKPTAGVVTATENSITATTSGSASAYAIALGNETVGEVLWTGTSVSTNQVWEGLGAVVRTNTMSSVDEQLTHSKVSASAIAYGDGVLYWAEANSSSIYAQSLVDPAATSTQLVVGNGSAICGTDTTPGAAVDMDFDVQSGWLYWATPTGELRRICARAARCPDYDADFEQAASRSNGTTSASRTEYGHPENGQLLRNSSSSNGGVVAVALYRPRSPCPFSDAVDGSFHASSRVAAACIALRRAGNASACAAEAACTGNARI